MNVMLRRCVSVFAAFFLTATVFAAEASPTGVWKWEIGPSGQGLEQTLELTYAAGKLAGTLRGTQSGPFKFPDTPIEDASFRGGGIKFSVTRELNGTKVTTKYEGKLDGDTIKGTSERPNLQGGDPVKREWAAKRVK